MRRLWRVGATLVVTGLCTAYILWKIDVGKTWHVLTHARVAWFVAALAIMVVSVWPMAWRWQRLLAARGVHETLPRLVRTYFVGYAAGQVLPTALGGDASRIYETARRHEGAGGAAAGTVLLERALGGAATLTLAVAGFSMDDLNLTVEDNQLVVRGKQTDDGGRVYLHRGIAARQFQRSFVLAEGIGVRGAWLDNGLLHVDLVRPPMEARVKTIEIRGPAQKAPSRLR